MAERIEVTRNTRVTITRILKKARDQRTPIDPVDITAFKIQFAAKFRLTDPDSAKLFDITATIIDGPTGVYELELSTPQTNLLPAIYFGEIRWWEDGDDTKPPHDRIPVAYEVLAAVDSVV